MNSISLTLILVIMTGFISFQAFQKPAMRAKLLFHPYSVKHNGEYIRFLTSGFVHADWGHLLINLFVLYQFGEVAEVFFDRIFGAGWGSLAFLGFYLSAIVLASAPTYFRHQDNPGYSALGASGATSALVFVYVFLAPWQWFLFPPLPAILLAIAYLWYSSYMDKHGTDHIGHNVHFWGAVYGFVFILISALAFQPAYVRSFINQLLQGPSLPGVFG